MNWLETRRARRLVTAVTDRRSEAAAMRAEADSLDDRAVVLRTEALCHDEETDRLERDG